MIAANRRGAESMAQRPTNHWEGRALDWQRLYEAARKHRRRLIRWGVAALFVAFFWVATRNGGAYTAVFVAVMTGWLVALILCIDASGGFEGYRLFRSLWESRFRAWVVEYAWFGFRFIVLLLVTMLILTALGKI
jgi:hypothetical protein